MRPARLADLPAILELARYLDSPNLPNDEAFVRRRLERAERSFRTPGPPGPDAEYQFALVDDSGGVIGTCAVLSKHGTPEMPHVFMRVGEETRYSQSTGVRVTHTTLQLGASRDGPTELGSLILHPSARGRPGWPGKLLSWGRFAYIARHRSSFENRILAEMRAAIDAHGRSAFWDAFGRRFTGMSYTEADHRSASDKSFILDLFPDTPFYASLLDAAVAAQLGQVHEEAAPALRLLEMAGMHWIDEIDPFDGGPFVGAPIARVTPIQQTVRAVVAEGAPPDGAAPAIISSEEGGEFRAVAAPAALDGVTLRIGKEARRRLGVSTRDEVAHTPLPRSSGKAAGGG